MTQFNFVDSFTVVVVIFVGISVVVYVIIVLSAIQLLSIFLHIIPNLQVTKKLFPTKPYWRNMAGSD